MKTKFLTIKKRTIFAVLLCILAIGAFCGAYFPVKANTSPKPVHTIVIDAGHGGRDGGAVGKQTDVTESYLNLKYALALERIASGYGFNVVQTRSDMNGLYNPLAANKKRSEMEKRVEIMKNAGADIVISLHMNASRATEAKGSQVYYANGSESGKALADSVSKNLHNNLENAKLTSKVGDFYVLNCSPCPAILVECGFLSNINEELLLQDEDYMQKFCYHLFCGVLQYFNFS